MCKVRLLSDSSGKEADTAKGDVCIADIGKGSSTISASPFGARLEHFES
jgi:hypothetical protein